MYQKDIDRNVFFQQKIDELTKTQNIDNYKSANTGYSNNTNPDQFNALLEQAKQQALIVEAEAQKQVKEAQARLEAEKLNAEAGDKVSFDQVLMLDSKIGSPYLTNVTVEGEVIKNGKQKKIRVFKYKSKDRSNRKTQGHRQPYTKIKITKING